MILLPTKEDDLDAYLMANDSAAQIGDVEPRRFELPPANLLEFRAKGPRVEDLPMCFFPWVMSDKLVNFVDRMQPGVLRRSRITFDSSTPDRLRGEYWYVWCDLELECHDAAKSALRYIGNDIHLDYPSVDPLRVPDGVHFFRQKYRHRALCVSSAFLAGAKRDGLVGVRC